MPCRMGELRQKEVISVNDGGRLGFGREPDTVIPWSDIEMIGGDIVLVKCDAPPQSESLFTKLWKKLTG